MLMLNQKVVLILGSKSDLNFAKTISDMLEKFEVDYEYHVASAHKTPEHLLKILKKHEKTEGNIVYITVAGLSDALSGFVAAFTRYPVIACPPDIEKHGWPKVFSSAMTPRGVAVPFVSKAENAALAAVKILALANPSLYERINRYMQERKEEVMGADGEVKKGKSLV